MFDVLRICYAALPNAGEDSYALHTDEECTFLCVTDGCGGLGSKRYEKLENCTGAYIAARLAARTFADWAQVHQNVPIKKESADVLCRELSDKLFYALKDFADAHNTEEKSRIVGSMQRRFPTTLCAVTAYKEHLCFWWAGDSRGYVLDAFGLHQFTRDHVRGQLDPFEMLYRDAPLSNLLSADQKKQLQYRMTTLYRPSVVIVATDGVYSGLPTPMEAEMLLLDTLRLAKNISDWEQRLQKCIAANAQDDATMLMLPIGFQDFDQMKETLMPRRKSLQKQFITPVRRHKGDIHYAHEKWLQYQPLYDCTEAQHE